MPQAKTEVALQFSECCGADVALQALAFLQCGCHFDQKLRCSKQKLQCNIEKAALQESGDFLPLSCGFQAPTFRHPRLEPAETYRKAKPREDGPSEAIFRDSPKMVSEVS